MSKVQHFRSRFTTVSLILVSFIVVTGGGIALGDGLMFSPFKLVLNSQGQAEDLQAIVPMCIASGCLFDGGEASLYIEGELIATSSSMRYCYIDDNLLIGFDKEEVLSHPLVQELAGNTVEAFVDGYFEATCADGDSYTQLFDGSDFIEIMAPGKNSENSK